MKNKCEGIYTYTRQQAIKNGDLIDLATLYPNICSQLYKFPIAVTSEVWEIIERAASGNLNENDYEGVVWDILWMSQKGITKRIDNRQHLFQVVITRTGSERLHTFKIIYHHSNNGEPVLTIMMTWED